MHYKLHHRFLFWVLLFTSPLAAQLPQHFSGLARTQVPYLVWESQALESNVATDSPILTEIPGVPLPTTLAALRQELVNLPAITNATWRIDSTDGQPVAVRWEMEESRTVFPLLNIGGVKGNFYYLLGINDIHFRGRGQQLTAFYQNNDGEHNYYLGLTNRNYRGSRWGYELESRRYASREPVFFPGVAVDYRYANLSFGIGAVYTTPSRHVFRLGISNFYEHYLKVNPELTTPGPSELQLNKGLLKAGHNYNRVDYFAERLNGTDHRTAAQLVHDFTNNSNFLIAWYDFRAYRLVGKQGNLASRLRVGLSSNENSPFAPFVLDSQFNIRGSGNRIDRGTAQLVFNLEYRHTIWKERRERFAGQLVGFSDLGGWRNPGGRLEDVFSSNSIRHFVGLGVRAISLKAFDAALRIDYGVDVRDRNSRGVVVGFGQYF